MSLPPLPILDVPPAEEPWFLAPGDVLVLTGDAPLPLPLDAAPADLAPDAAAPVRAIAAAPPVLPEDAFPTMAELDAILAAHDGPPPVLDAAARAELAAALGLDPAIAEDLAAFEAAIAALPEPMEKEIPSMEHVTPAEDPFQGYPALPGGWLLG